MASKFQVTPVSEHQAQLIQAWAVSTGRPVSALCASLLDQAVSSAMEQGRIPTNVTEMVDELFEEERELARLEVQLAQLKARNSRFVSLNGLIAATKYEIEEEKASKQNTLKQSKKTTVDK